MASPGLRARASWPRGPADGRLPVPRRPSEPVLASSLARRPGRGRMADSFNDGLGCRIGYLLLPRFSMMSFTAAVEPLRSVNRLLGRDHYEWILVTADRSEEHTSELQSLMRISYAVFSLQKKK